MLQQQLQNAGNYGNGSPELITALLQSLGWNEHTYATHPSKFSYDSGDALTRLDRIGEMLGISLPMLLGSHSPAPPPVETDYDPEIDAPELFATMRQQNVWGLVARQMFEGSIDKVGAINAIKADPAYADYDRAYITPIIEGLWTEVAAARKGKAKHDADQLDARSKWEADDPYRKAGLPSPFEQYTADTLPLEGDELGRIAQFHKQGKAMDADPANYGTKYDPNYKKPQYNDQIPLSDTAVDTKDRKFKTKNTTTGGTKEVTIPAEQVNAIKTASGRNTLDPKLLAAVAAQSGDRLNRGTPVAPRQREYAQRYEEGYKAERARLASERGRTPLSDNIRQQLLPFLMILGGR